MPYVRKHPLDEGLSARDLDAIAELRRDRPFVLGDKSRTVDATAFAFLVGTFGYPLDTALKRHAQSHANLVAYRKRIRARWWPDLPAVA